MYPACIISLLNELIYFEPVLFMSIECVDPARHVDERPFCYLLPELTPPSQAPPTLV